MNKQSFRILSKQILLTQSKKNNNFYQDSKIQQSLLKIIASFLHHKRCCNILCYHPLPIEFNTKKMLLKLKKNKKITIFLPFMEDISFKKVKFRLPLQKTHIGLYQPNYSSLSQQKLDIAIIPTLGIDGEFKRIGFGKGMYDRYFYSLQPQPLKIFVCRSFNYFEQSLTYDYDLQGDFFITPFGIVKRGYSHDNMDHFKLSRFCFSNWIGKLSYLKTIRASQFKHTHRASKGKSQSHRTRSTHALARK